MDAREFLATARDLARSEQPAYRRTAISRAYYAVYHVAFDPLFTLGFRVEREHRGHETVRAYLAQSRLTSIIQTGAQLRDLHNLRVKADYWLRDPHPERGTVVTVWMERVARMIAALDGVAADPAARARMTTAIQAWERAAGGPRCASAHRHHRADSSSRAGCATRGSAGGGSSRVWYGKPIRPCRYRRVVQRLVRKPS